MGCRIKVNSMLCKLPFGPGFKGPKRRAVPALGTMLLKWGASLRAAGLLCPTEPRAHLSWIRETTWGEGAREAWGWAGGPECVTFSRHRPCDGRRGAEGSDSVLTIRDGSGFR